MITSEPATVYRGGGRRWLTVMGACRAEARERVKEKCGCESEDHYPGYVCDYHREANLERTAALVDRLARFYRRRYRSPEQIEATA